LVLNREPPGDVLGFLEIGGVGTNQGDRTIIVGGNQSPSPRLEEGVRDGHDGFSGAMVSREIKENRIGPRSNDFVQ
jgi:hypothetical protein